MTFKLFTVNIFNKAQNIVKQLNLILS